MQEFLNSLPSLGIASVVSGAFTYLFTRRKYNSETDRTDIDNLREIINVYKATVEDLKRDQKELKAEIKQMRTDFEQRLEQAKRDCYEN